MSETAPKNAKGWQPLTPRGVAAFAYSKWRRLLLTQLVFAVLTAVVAVWFLRTAWFPTIREAINQLPVRGEIRAGKLDWRGDSPQLLAEGHFLAFTVDTNHTGTVKSPAHFQIEFGNESARFFSLLGFHDFPYSKEYIVEFNRTDLDPWWGAWQPPILWITVGVVIPGLLLTWALLASAYAVPAWLIGFFANRNLSFWSSWKLAGAALMPGALMMVLTIFLYGLGLLDLVQLLAGFAAHWVVGWIYVGWAVLVSSKMADDSTAKNPFAK